MKTKDQLTRNYNYTSDTHVDIENLMSTYANQILDEVLNTCFEDLGEGVTHFNKHKLAEIRKKI